ncbi:MAG: hypothetical protein IPG89_07100 [Bacteroidetes bacterium]|nr:hypothetical protein [Bacteroidota bacterium]
MYSKEPVWLTTDQIINKYFEFCFERNITERFLVKLFDAHLLRGQNNRKLKKVEILEESFLELIKHINYNLQIQMYRFSEEKISVPNYCEIGNKITTYSIDKSWYTASEILYEMPAIKYHKIFTVDFINELMDKGMLRGRIDRSQKVGLILFCLPFMELLKYRNYIKTKPDRWTGIA